MQENHEDQALCLAADAAARERALALASFIVEAPAGAGKTELLTQRVLRLLAVVEAPEEVLALTFTNKAASEMRDRILSSLDAAALPAPEDLPPHKAETRRWAQAVQARDAEKNWGLGAHPGRLRIMTLDALAASLARQMPLLSRFGAQPQVTEKAAEHYAAAARQTFALLEDGGPTGEILAGALQFMDNDAPALEKLLVDMLSRREQWLPQAASVDGGMARREDVEAAFAALIVLELRQAASIFDAKVQAALMPSARFAASQLPAAFAHLADWQSPLTGELADLPAWQQLADLFLTQAGTWRKSVNKNQGFLPGKEFAEQKAAMQALLQTLAPQEDWARALAAVRALPPAKFSDAQWAAVENFSRLLRLAAGQLWLIFQAAGEVDFVEIASRANLALGDDDAPTDLAQALDYRIQHLLVDEFQDTSPGQVALLEKLMRGWVPGDGRTLFVVGDPMQSIYRFRKADVGLFLKVRETGMGGVPLEHLRLYRNNRSHPAVVDWVNQVFPQIFAPIDEPLAGAVRFSAAVATRAPHPASAVQVHSLLARQGEDGSAEEAALALRLIEAARARDPQGRIAILVRARRHLEALVATLRREAPALRFQAVEIEALSERQHVADVLILYRALSHRADRVNWLALLRSPCCGLCLADLHALAAGDNRRTVWQLMHDAQRLAALSEDGRGRLLHVRGVLAQALAERQRQSPRRWLEGTWLLLGGADALPQASDVADIENLFELIERLHLQGRLTPDALTQALDDLYAPADPLGGAIQMMTIHKAKGLEFETVIVPGLARSPKHNDSPLLLWDEAVGEEGQAQLLVAPMAARGEKRGEASLYDLLRQLEKQRSRHESERLLYVAATRAIGQLHWLAVVKTQAENEAEAEATTGADAPEAEPTAAEAVAPNEVKAPPPNSFLALLWPQIGTQCSAAALLQKNMQKAAPALALETFVPPLLRLPQLQLPAQLATPAPPAVAAPEVEAQTHSRGANVAATRESLTGTLIHRCLELIVREGLAAWPLERLARCRGGWQHWLQARGLPAEEVALACAETEQALRNTLNSPRGRWLLSAHPESDVEQGWTTQDAQGSAQHIIDRVFVAEGERWIIDYKNVRAPTSELPAKAEEYRAQLERYAALFAADPRPIRLAIWFALQGEFVELAKP
ncbi:UvrD-helicase domain-containing protein [Azonexus sp.]|uniref:UvrD-helicase domain-containing protein n=1 Tax=Azonexus sp. TaxID=1872668 RepID=UPI0039E5CBE5